LYLLGHSTIPISYDAFRIVEIDKIFLQVVDAYKFDILNFLALQGTSYIGPCGSLHYLIEQRAIDCAVVLLGSSCLNLAIFSVCLAQVFLIVIHMFFLTVVVLLNLLLVIEFFEVKSGALDITSIHRYFQQFINFKAAEG
jgi:hypothetical protein